MDFLNIGNKKLKATLSASECLHYKINAGDSEFLGAEIRRTVREILEIAEAECGFSREDDKVLVQIYPIPEGGCELMVTRLGTVSPKERRAIAATEGLTMMHKRRGTYRFASRGDLERAIAAAWRSGVACDLYRDDLGRYYISVIEEVADGISEFEIFVEFGERLSALPIGVMGEYGTLLAKNDGFAYVTSQRLKE